MSLKTDTEAQTGRVRQWSDRTGEEEHPRHRESSVKGFVQEGI